MALPIREHLCNSATKKTTKYKNLPLINFT